MDEREKNKPIEQIKESTTLDDLMDRERTIPSEYQPLIDEAEERKFYSPEAYSEGWRIFLILAKSGSINPDKEFFKETLKDAVLIDLGGGTHDMMKKFSREFGVNTLINVDRGIHRKDIPVDAFSATRKETRDNLQEIDINADILAFVSQMKDSSADSFVLNGIDRAVSPNPDFHRALAKELGRATKPGGIIFGIDSEIDGALESLEKEIPVERFNLDAPITSSFVYKKTEEQKI